jgi:uncharacterized protein (DUF2384 family)
MPRPPKSTRFRGLGERPADKAVSPGAPKATRGHTRKAGHAKGGDVDSRLRPMHTLEHRAGGPLFDDQGLVDIERMAAAFRMSKTQLAETAGINPETFYRDKRAAAPKTQARVREMLEIVNRIADWAGGTDQAVAWYRAEPIPAFGGRTAESLVKDGQAGALRDWLDHVATGGFA